MFGDDPDTTTDEVPAEDDRATEPLHAARHDGEIETSGLDDLDAAVDRLEEMKGDGE